MFEEQSQSSREESKYGRASVLPATSEPAWEMEFAPVGENPPTAPPDESYDVSRRSSRDFVQDGVRGMEAISLAWTGWSLLVPYCRYVYTTLIHSQTDIWSADGHRTFGEISILAGSSC